MAWTGTGVIWSVNGGILSSTAMGQEPANTPESATAELTFVQISDSHIGFNKPANTDVVGTTREAIRRLNALPKTPDFVVHTGDLTHLSEPAEFDTLAQLMSECRTKDVLYVPGEHDYFDNGEQYRERFGKNAMGAGWYSFNQMGVHFIALVNVADSQEGGLGTLGQDNLIGSKRTSKAYPAVLRSSCSRTSRCGLSIHSGVGEPTTPSELFHL
jgi:predicted MPP superfamily phosphohydrolase